VQSTGLTGGDPKSQNLFSEGLSGRELFYKISGEDLRSKISK
jgi:hypothetical protein